MSERKTGFGGGLLPVVMVLVILLLSVFGVLAVASSSSRTRLADRAETAAAAYYAAERNCAETAAEAASLLAEGKDPEGLCEVQATADGRLLTFVSPIDENRQLEMIYLAGENGRMTFLKKTSVTVTQWEEDFLDVWTGE